MQTFKLPTRLQIQLNTTWNLEENQEAYTTRVVYINCNAVNASLNICIGQTGRIFKFHYREHTNASRTNRQKSKFEQQILETGHEYDTLDQTMGMLQIEKRAQAQHIRKTSYIRQNQEGSTNEQ
jgi:hypothetical protein